ncbi:MAG: isomerase/hydrolase [Balneola sp.]|mgnify:FL=1|jgi:2-keto-4-pentenoate hydratase/2-oxohepta-3-ene-1,7-dioic acid hydratase in catechol pathway|nr:isomerase/hydrolase [Balneola sp.]MBE78609.1 isomerase/hydrolase [Balneola sp.]HBX66230.1 fumarylacetoacetate hydrolase family protein [Balneolaceae bacterium]|tara:strand:+ start:674 stop:1327 length:654 start_codon:yes stop_codon:yes gene_type:complete
MKNPSIPGLDLDVNNIYCIGRNYAQHAKEMGSAIPKVPLVFLKPLGTICHNDATISIPPHSNDVHYEAEIVIAISKEGKNISHGSAMDHVGGYGVGIDFTARDIQSISKKQGQPWTIAKGFDNFAPISSFVPFSEINNPDDLDIKLFQNGFVKQHGNSSEMIFPVPNLINFLSGIFTLYPGDLIFTGTPEGVGPVASGDKLEVLLDNGITTLTVNIE